MTKPSRSEYYKEWYAKNKEARRITNAAWTAANKDRIEAKRKARMSKLTPEEKRARYLKTDRAKATQRQRTYAVKNPEKMFEIMRRYRVALKQATPKWLTSLHKAQIKKLKADAAMASALSGVRMTIDHIVPLQNPIVCGLHVPWNIQIRSLVANASKGARTWPGMP